jgi:hypothetical protein
VKIEMIVLALEDLKLWVSHDLVVYCYRKMLTKDNKKEARMS